MPSVKMVADSCRLNNPNEDYVKVTEYTKALNIQEVHSNYSSQNLLS